MEETKNTDGKKKKPFYMKIISFVREEWKFLIFIILMYLGLTYEFPYVIYTPGGAINMSERIEGNHLYSEDGSISMTYVSMVKGTAPFLLLAQFIPNWDIVSSDNITYDDESLDESIEIDKIYMQEAIANAEYVAYVSSGINYSEYNTRHLVTYVNKDAITNLKYGDEIISIDGVEYSNLEDFQEYIQGKSPGDKVIIEYSRDGTISEDEVTLIEIDDTTKVGISIVTLNDYETDYDISVKTKDSESGPSGGLMTALAIYNRLTDTDITKGKVIMGTGTISKDGTVGEIGGVKYKLLGAVNNHAEVFLCPMENYEEALEVKKENDMDIEIIGVGTFMEAIEALNNVE